MRSARITLLNDLRARVEGLRKAHVEKLDEALSFHRSEFWWRSPAARSGLWDGKTHLFNALSETVPLGLLTFVTDWLREQRYEIHIADERTSVRREGRLRPLHGIELRDYQRAAVQAAVEHERGVLQVPTAGGKSFIAAGIVQALTDEKGRFPVTLFFTHRKNLAKQMQANFARALNVSLDAIGMIHGGKWLVGTSGVHIAIIDTLTAEKFTGQRRMLYKLCELLIIEEAHHAPSGDWNRTLNHCKARRRVGITATPIGRSDGADLMLTGQTGPVIYSISAEQLMAQGWLARPKVCFCRVKEPRVPSYLDSTWSDVYEHGIVKHTMRNRLVSKLAMRCARLRKRTLILVQEIEHGERLQRILPGSAFVNGQRAEEDNDADVQTFERGERPLLIATQEKFGEGVDIPSIEVVIVAAGGKAHIQTVQRIGRGMRPKADNRLLVIDFWDLHHAKLFEHSELRRAHLKKLGYETKLVKAAGTEIVSKFFGVGSSRARDQDATTASVASSSCSRAKRANTHEQLSDTRGPVAAGQMPEATDHGSVTAGQRPLVRSQ